MNKKGKITVQLPNVVIFFQIVFNSSHPKKRILNPAFFIHVHTTLHLTLSIRPSVRPSVTLYFFGVFEVFGLTAPAQ